MFFSDGQSEYLPAPLGTPIELSDVGRLELALQFLIANAAAARVSYRAIVNAHCVYERLSTGAPIDSNLISGATGTSISGQSYNETRAVDVTVLSPSDLAVEQMVLDGYLLYGGPPWSVHGFTIVQRRRWYLLPRMLMFQRQASASRLQYPCRRLSYPATAIESGFARLGASARMAISSCQPFHTLRVLACFKSTPLGTTRQMRFLKSRILPPLV